MTSAGPTHIRGATTRACLSLALDIGAVGDVVRRQDLVRAMDTHPRLARIAVEARSPTATRALRRLWELGAVDLCDNVFGWRPLSQRLEEVASRSEDEHVQWTLAPVGLEALDRHGRPAEANARRIHGAALQALATRGWPDVQRFAPFFKARSLIVLPLGVALLAS